MPRFADDGSLFRNTRNRGQDLYNEAFLGGGPDLNTPIDVKPTAIDTNCPDGQTFDNVNQRCMDKCPDGQYREYGTDKCVDDFVNQATKNTNTSGGGGGSKPASNPYDDVNARLLAEYQKLYGGSDVPLPYDAATIARLEGKLKGNAESAAATKKQQLLASRSAMGLGTDGRTGQGLRNITDQAAQQVSTGAIDINDTAIRANVDVQISNLTRKLQILESQANFAIALASNANQRQSIQYNYMIQKMQLEQQMEMLRLQLINQNLG